MEQALIGLLSSSPAAVAVIITVIKFLAHLSAERKEWRTEAKELREAVIGALNHNSEVIKAHSESMTAQAETLRSLINIIEKHDEMARQAVARLEGR